MKGAVAAMVAYWADGGWLLLPIACVLFGIWAYWFRLRYALRKAVADAHRAEKHLDHWLTGRMNAQAWRSAMAGDPAWTPRLVVDVYDTAANGPEARRLFHAQAAWQWDRIKRDLFVLKALTAAAPLLGLLGTVSGMVDTFSAVSRHGAESAALVARGISTALVTTQFGLVAALPGVFGALNLGRHRTRLMSAHNAIGGMLSAAFRNGNAKGAA
jgi:biopolymer transport protein ExbB